MILWDDLFTRGYVARLIKGPSQSILLLFMRALQECGSLRTYISLPNSTMLVFHCRIHYRIELIMEETAIRKFEPMNRACSAVRYLPMVQSLSRVLVLLLRYCNLLSIRRNANAARTECSPLSMSIVCFQCVHYLHCDLFDRILE